MDPKETENLNMLKAILGWNSFYTNLKNQEKKIKWKQVKLVENFKLTILIVVFLFVIFICRNIIENKGYLNLKKSDLTLIEINVICEVPFYFINIIIYIIKKLNYFSLIVTL